MKKLQNKAYAVKLALRRGEHELDRKRRKRARRQQGTRVASAPGKSTRGKGTVEMIEAFENLGSSVDLKCIPEMSLISGSTRIYFNNKYHLKDQDVEGGKRKIIAFNENNSLDEKPDSDHVNSLAGHFPGTLLTFKFFIDARYLEKCFTAAKQQKVANATND